MFVSHILYDFESDTDNDMGLVSRTQKVLGKKPRHGSCPKPTRSHESSRSFEKADEASMTSSQDSSRSQNGSSNGTTLPPYVENNAGQRDSSKDADQSLEKSQSGTAENNNTSGEKHKTKPEDMSTALRAFDAEDRGRCKGRSERRRRWRSPSSSSSSSSGSSNSNHSLRNKIKAYFGRT